MDTTTTFTTNQTAETPPRRRRLDAHTMAVSGLVFGLFAMAASMFAVALAAQAADEARDATSAASKGTVSTTEGSTASQHGATGDAPAGGAGPVAATVTLKEFSLGPAAVTVAAGSALRVDNSGSIPHNLTIESKATPLLDHSGSADLQLGGLAAGTYTMRCTVPGHEAAGMRGTVTIQ